MPTKIQWADEVWNPVTGCTKISEGCKHCYAERMSKRLAGRFGYPADEPFRVTLHPDRLEQPLRWRKPRRVFVNSMSDFFHHAISFRFQLNILRVIAQCPQHTFMILTKRVDQLAMWEYACGWHPYPNLWLGVSVENQKRADERISSLLQIPAAKHFVSLEPLLGPIDLDRTFWKTPRDLPDQTTMYNWLDAWGLNLVIVGAESGPGARPMDPDWARDILDQCRIANVPFFMKSMSGGAPIPDDLLIREFPSERG